ncbi:MAG: bifunctional adenosylcobinamide kinase/adenosylcobinamide-phosphate guanylyltransferase [Candidatus Omnitrophota bacterium]
MVKNMRRFIVILGGVKSGKSRYAISLAKKYQKKVVFVATAEALDREMKERIKLHKRSRPASWKVVEERSNLVKILPLLAKQYAVIMVDCIGLLVSNMLMDGLKDKQIERQLNGLVRTIAGLKIITIIVSNDVGCGIVPADTLSRRFRDLVGIVNQQLAMRADEVVFMQAGIAVRIKSGE